MKEEFKVSWVKIIARSMAFKDGNNTLIFYIFPYGVEYGAECSVQCGAK